LAGFESVVVDFESDDFDSDDFDDEDDSDSDDDDSDDEAAAFFVEDPPDRLSVL
jgi:hypothetical protein